MREHMDEEFYNINSMNRRTLFDTETLNSVINELSNIQKELSDVRDNKSTMGKAYRNLGYDCYSTFRRWLVALPKKKNNVMTVDTNLIPELFGTEKIYEEIFETEKMKRSVALPTDCNETLEYVMNLVLDDRERTIINRRASGDTLQEIADDMCLTRERVRQLEARSYRKMRTPRSKEILTTGITKYKINAECEKQMLEEEAKMKTLRAQQERLNLKDNLDCTDAAKEILLHHLHKSAYDTLPNLSNRSYNGLIRYGRVLGHVVTIGDVLNMNISGLYRVRNLGTKSVNEVWDKTMEYLKIHNINMEEAIKAYQ